MTFGEGLALLLFPGWYPPFVQRLGPPFVGPASVPAAGAHVEDLLLAGSSVVHLKLKLVVGQLFTAKRVSRPLRYDRVLL